MSSIRLLVVYVFLFIISVSYVQAKEAYQGTEEDASTFVKKVLDEVYTELPLQKSKQEKYDYFTKFTTKYFGFSYMSAWSLGNYIRTLDAESKKKYLDISKKYMVFYYGDVFDKTYKLYNFDIYTAKKQGSNYIVKLRARLKRRNSAKDDNEVIDIAWKLKYSKSEQTFYIVDIILNNISFMNVQRADFQSLYTSSNKDINKFLEKITDKVNEKRHSLGFKPLGQ